MNSTSGILFFSFIVQLNILVQTDIENSNFFCYRARRGVPMWAPHYGIAGTHKGHPRGRAPIRGAPTRICELASDAVRNFICIFSLFNYLKHVPMIV